MTQNSKIDIEVLFETSESLGQLSQQGTPDAADANETDRDRLLGKIESGVGGSERALRVRPVDRDRYVALG